MRSITATLITTAIATSTLLISAHSWAANNGEVRQSVEHGMQAWNEANKQWLTMEAFWDNYANNRQQKNWPASSTYPKYEELKEGDTFLVHLKDSSCLMEFYHSRWRRANDVRRWDDAFNAYGACPFVFE